MNTAHVIYGFAGFLTAALMAYLLWALLFAEDL
ncbi:potassium-transporting ATPase subunit F [Ramlibacter aquaticus]|uniref:Potassium-transporting ATPase subunit F n=1 Tax=Ramlibacter aquaticus TaxID=2780094 RepID=A0ABR9SBU7_9BURK|nr:potassium-transporting ATPase subunit F [Ramlibacter aquaticus]MBE7939689.1 potassium-transporting ATPase subunit F [Ramlibacter aquaticus]